MWLLLSAIDVAVFERRPDGSFALAPPPRGLRIVADATFPFLGHILEEANEFWGRGSRAQDWGPCAEVDERERSSTTG